jgi:hypothetical protein
VSFSPRDGRLPPAGLVQAADERCAKPYAASRQALQAAQIGLGGPAQAAPAAIEVGYLPARFAVQVHESEPLPDQF